MQGASALFYFIGNTVIHSCVKVEPSYEIKTLREDAQLAVGKISLCEPLARGESRKRDSFLHFFYKVLPDKGRREDS